MKTYVVAWINFFDNLLEQKQVKATDEFDAIEKVNPPVLPEDWRKLGDLDEIYQEAFNCDGALSVIEVK